MNKKLKTLTFDTHKDWQEKAMRNYPVGCRVSHVTARNMVGTVIFNNGMYVHVEWPEPLLGAEIIWGGEPQLITDHWHGHGLIVVDTEEVPR